ncbi:hypothetical protein KR074_004367 [Drosophila pseudoananassae]|nr:hypothetical protein KR074_004367 [Drosophila pseudoananassae]
MGKVMAPVKVIIQYALDYFCILNGNVKFYKDPKTKRLQSSKILGFYRVFHNLLVLILTAKFVLDFYDMHGTEIETSTLIKLNFFMYFTLVYFSVLSCIHCSYFCEKCIFRVRQKLLDLKNYCRKHSYLVPSDKQQFLDGILFFVAVLLILRVSMNVILNVLQYKMGFHHPCKYILSENMILAMNTLAFGILMEICECWWRLQSGLEGLLSNQKPIPAEKQLRQIRELQRMFQTLMDLIIEVTCIFKLIFLCYLIRNIWSGIVLGYLIVRLFLISDCIAFMHIILAFVACVQPLLYAMLMNFMFCATDNLLEAVKDILRQPLKHSASVEKMVGWFYMQMARQHTYIFLFGTFRINRACAFKSAACILVHVFYMVQADYIILFE